MELESMHILLQKIDELRSQTEDNRELNFLDSVEGKILKRLFFFIDNL